MPGGFRAKIRAFVAAPAPHAALQAAALQPLESAAAAAASAFDDAAEMAVARSLQSKDRDPAAWAKVLAGRFTRQQSATREGAKEAADDTPTTGEQEEAAWDQIDVAVHHNSEIEWVRSRQAEDPHHIALKELRDGVGARRMDPARYAVYRKGVAAACERIETELAKRTDGRVTLKAIDGCEHSLSATLINGGNIGGVVMQPPSPEEYAWLIDYDVAHATAALEVLLDHVVVACGATTGVFASAAEFSAAGNELLASGLGSIEGTAARRNISYNIDPIEKATQAKLNELMRATPDSGLDAMRQFLEAQVDASGGTVAAPFHSMIRRNAKKSIFDGLFRITHIGSGAAAASTIAPPPVPSKAAQSVPPQPAPSATAPALPPQPAPSPAVHKRVFTTSGWHVDNLRSPQARPPARPPPN